ncbi:MAG: hypothetical protein ACC656_08975 [Candidatus Heimdallarchaeota archaeon]
MKTFNEILGPDCFENTYYNKYVELTETKYSGCNQVFDEDNDIVFAHEVKLEIHQTGIEIKLRRFSASIWLNATSMGSAHYDEAIDFIVFDNTKKLNSFIEYWQQNEISEFMHKKTINSFGIDCFSDQILNKQLCVNSHNQLHQIIEEVKNYLENQNIEIVVHQKNLNVDLGNCMAKQDAIEFVFNNKNIIIEMNWRDGEAEEFYPELAEVWPIVYINDNNLPFDKTDTLNKILNPNK